MATIINNPSGTREVREIQTTDSGAGWIVAAVIIVALILLIALFVWPGYVRTASAPAATPATQTTPGNATVNVTVPSSGSTGSTGATGASSGAGSASVPSSAPGSGASQAPQTTAPGTY